MRFLERPDFVVLETAGPRVEEREADAIKPRQSTVGSQPKIAIPSLHNLPDSRMRQTLAFPPVVDRILGRVRMQIEVCPDVLNP